MSRPVRIACHVAVLAASVGLFLRSASAQRLGPQGSPITTSNYVVDLYQGPVLASARITGLAGAFVGIAEGSEAIPFNPASASWRPAYSTTHLDYDLTAGATLPSSVVGTDFDNDGKKGFRYDDFIWLSAGGILQIGKLGIGASLAGQFYDLGTPQGGMFAMPSRGEGVGDLYVRLLRLDAVTSYAFFNEELHIGAGIRVASLQLTGTGKQLVTGADGGTSLGNNVGERMLFATTGIGVQAGALWTPYALPLRAGLTVRSPIASAVEDGSLIEQDSNGNRAIGNFYLPRRVDLPWEIEWGTSILFGPRRYNERWRDEDKFHGPEVEAERKQTKRGLEPAYKAARRILRRREAARPRPWFLLTSSAVVTGLVQDAVGFESMLERVTQRSGQRASLGVRAAIEAEVIPRWVQLRLGSYLEPTRFTTAATRETDEGEILRPRPRLHGTAGIQAKLFKWDVFGLFNETTEWRVSLSGDLARQYFGWGFGVGIWH